MLLLRRRFLEQADEGFCCHHQDAEHEVRHHFCPAFDSHGSATVVVFVVRVGPFGADAFFVDSGAVGLFGRCARGAAAVRVDDGDAALREAVRFDRGSIVCGVFDVVEDGPASLSHALLEDDCGLAIVRHRAAQNRHERHASVAGAEVEFVAVPVLGVAFGVLFAAVPADYGWHVEEVGGEAVGEVTFESGGLGFGGALALGGASAFAFERKGFFCRCDGGS